MRELGAYRIYNVFCVLFFFNDTATTEIYTLSLHDALPISFQLGQDYIPGCLNINQDENQKIQAEINPVPHYIRNWQSMEHKKNAVEFAKHDWWNDNKTLIMTIIAVAICAAMVLGCTYLTYKFVSIDAEATRGLADTIKNLATIPGR